MTSKKNARIIALEKDLAASQFCLDQEARGRANDKAIAKERVDREIAARNTDKAVAEEAAKRNVERAAVEWIENGFVPIEALRKATREDVLTTTNLSFTHSDLTLHLNHADPIANAIRKAIVQPEKPKYATGGIVSGSTDLSTAAAKALDAMRVAGIFSPRFGGAWPPPVSPLRAGHVL